MDKTCGPALIKMPAKYPDLCEVCGVGPCVNYDAETYAKLKLEKLDTGPVVAQGQIVPKEDAGE